MGGEHLSSEQVLRLLALVQETDAVVVGGQSVNLWALHYLPRVPQLAAHMPFTSKDVDFYGTRKTAEHVARALDGTLYLPGMDDATPNAAVVVASLDGREVQIDFMASVLGVEDRAIANNYVVIAGREPTSGASVRVVVLHPLDCLRSRLANINVLGRHDDRSVHQAKASLLVLGAFLDDLLARGERRHVQTVLNDLFFVARDASVSKPSHQRHGIEPGEVMKRFRGDARLDARWREMNLATAIRRLDARYAAATPGRPAPPRG